jgi:hypothetical protein
LFGAGVGTDREVVEPSPDYCGRLATSSISTRAPQGQTGQAGHADAGAGRQAAVARVHRVLRTVIRLELGQIDPGGDHGPREEPDAPNHDEKNLVASGTLAPFVLVGGRSFRMRFSSKTG